jgi:hypothetical protein
MKFNFKDNFSQLTFKEIVVDLGLHYTYKIFGLRLQLISKDNFVVDYKNG